MVAHLVGDDVPLDRFRVEVTSRDWTSALAKDQQDQPKRQGNHPQPSRKRGCMAGLGRHRCPTAHLSQAHVQNGRMSLDLDELRRLRRARDRMDREYAQPLDVVALARTALMSPAHFSRRFREEYAETPYSYLMTRRIERAKALLRRGDLSVTDVCFAVGWTSLGSFSARFTEVVGESPSIYRARNHDELRVVPPCQAMVLTRPRRGRSQVRAEESSFGEAPVAAPA
jgi:transcriptional regulator GlxA family with amidase domain